MDEVSAQKKTEIHQLLMKLERNHNLLKKFLEKLNSYTCEPNDYSCFAKRDQLKQELEDLTKDQEKLFDGLRQNVSLKKSYLEKMSQFDKRFQELDQQMAAYLLEIKKDF